MDKARQRLSRPRAADGFTPAFDSTTERYMDEHSPLRNPALAQAAFDQAKALREGGARDGDNA